MNYIIVGTRPQFVKLYGFLKEEPGEYYIIHTGQHYDYEMSKIFFDGLNIPSPDINLDVKGSFPNQVTEIMNSLSQFDITEKDNVIVFGDCSSTLAGALYAKMVIGVTL